MRHSFLVCFFEYFSCFNLVCCIVVCSVSEHQNTYLCFLSSYTVKHNSLKIWSVWREKRKSKKKILLWKIPSNRFHSTPLISVSISNVLHVYRYEYTSDCIGKNKFYRIDSSLLIHGSRMKTVWGASVVAEHLFDQQKVRMWIGFRSHQQAIVQRLRFVSVCANGIFEKYISIVPCCDGNNNNNNINITSKCWLYYIIQIKSSKNIDLKSFCK